MENWPLPLAFAPETFEQLRREQQRLTQAFEKHALAEAGHLAALRATLEDALAGLPGADPGFLARLRDNARVSPHLLHLSAHDGYDDLLNLPWHLVAEGCPNLFVSKGLPLRTGAGLAAYEPDLPLPLKVLVMVAAPDSGGARLDYEAEEKIILDALSGLMRSGEVEVDFTDDGSLSSLRRSLAANRYHVLYFSGHSAYGVLKHGDAPDGILSLEDEFSMQEVRTYAAEFAAALAEDESRLPALVVLSSCQSGQGGTEGGFRGVAHRLMQAGVPAVVAMGWSVVDFWATHFAGAFFKALAGRDTLGLAFNKALEAGRRRFDPAFPEEFFRSQSLIPQLFLTRQVSHLVRWQGAAEKRLSRAGEALLKGNDRLAAKLKKVNALFGREANDLLFIGRRRERKEALRALRDGRPVLLRGQGGMGKTALAAHLAFRRLAADPDGCLPLAFDQTTLSLENVCHALLDFLEYDLEILTMRARIAAIPEQWEKFALLYQTIREKGFKPFFIFDNLESFQEEEAGPLAPHIAELLDYFLKLKQPSLITGRYTLPEFGEERLHAVNLNEAPAGDFRQKCLHLPALRRLEVEGRSFDSIAATLHRSLGGNYRALEFFDELCRQAPGKAPDTLEALDELLHQRAGETLHHMAGDLVFGRLLGLLRPDDQRALLLLAEFRRPVLPFAVEWQDTTLEPAETRLARAADLTLAERRVGEAEHRTYFFVPPLVRELLARENLPRPDFDDGQAGAYYQKMDRDLNQQNYADLEEAFFHYERAGNVERVNETGNTLSRFYYGISQFQRSFGFAARTEAVAGEQTGGLILNRLGLLLQLSGNLDASLHFLQRKLADDHCRGDRQGEGTTLNNISQIYDAKGDYDTALVYLQQSLKIQQEIGDRKGEGATLNNLATTAHAKGDYERALEYLQQSLKIRQEIGDRKGEGATLNNLATIAHAKGDYDRALDYLQQSLKIQQEIGDRKGESVSLNNLSQIAKVKGDYDTALRYSEQDLKICQEIGDRKGEGVTLNNISQIYDAKGDYERALEYLQQSLKIQQEIGDRQGEGVTLNNISQIYDTKGDYERALDYLQQSLKIQQEIGDINGMAITLVNIGAMLFKQDKFEEAVPLLLQAYHIFEKIGSPNVQVAAGHLNAIVEKIGQERFEEIVQA